ncbi:hypothetical protein ElyMa_003096100 [Elysia marginata]|uniref:Uncharacterized protein n=1 Tax=Elysia marginata TaxID=1093978 RepID=A0AAV4ITL1_9GAST|nr:hypothetical protein ElyMa_003096100 [Elysia marginata]
MFYVITDMTFDSSSYENSTGSPMYKTHNTGYTDLCSCGEAAETLGHVLQDRHSFRMLRQAVRSTPTDLQTNLWGTIGELDKTNTFIHQKGITI